MKIVLIDDMILKDGLSWAKAVEALELTNKHPLAKIIVFSISHQGHLNKDTVKWQEWALIGRVKQLSRDFVTEPNDFVIELED